MSGSSVCSSPGEQTASRRAHQPPGGMVTPLEMAQRSVNEEIISPVQDGLPAPSPPSSSDAPLAPAKRQKLSKDGGDGIPHADFGSFGKSIRKLWAEYTGTLRQRNRENAWWFGEGPINKRNRNYYYLRPVED